ncbi:hypothetical protein HCN44_001216 [Aphidius gifuensis]|uniref:Uncharacterized protein n=1 Tax=Aphidius gifuensis TaxID=684658 RepID=A0A834XLS7_APHGI|nr:hypothetical protein HCN44_001216 [Aphidius gifuensis]
MEEDIINKKNINVVGGEVLPYKSSFAKSIVVNYRDLKTINNNDIKIENNNYSIDTTENTSTNISNIFSSSKMWDLLRVSNHVEPHPLQCQDLNEENQRLQSLLQTNQTPRVQAIDNVLLQTQIDTLTWQMKQNEASQQMYRSLMRQMLNFLERAKKSLDIIHERTNPIGKNKTSRNSQNLSIYADEPELITSSTITNTKFTRAKSITQISSSSSSSSSSASTTTTTHNSYSGIRDFTWSVLRKNDTSLNCSTPKAKNNNNKIIKKIDLNKTDDDIVKRRKNNNINNEINEENDDYVPPNKLSQESFRLMRTIESLLTTISSSPFSSTLSSASSTSSLSINEKDSTTITTTANNKKDINDNNNNNSKRINSLSTNDGSFIDDDYSFKQINDTFIISDENNKKYNNNIIKNNKNISKKLFNGNCSTNIRLQINKTATINDNELSILRDDKASSSIVNNNNNNNSADDESGFSSMNSFQDVGIPVTTATTTTTSTTMLPINNSPGLHTEIGLPDVPIDKNIKWPSNTIDLQLKIKNYKNEYINNNSNNNNRAKVEQRSVWV